MIAFASNRDGSIATNGFPINHTVTFSNLDQIVGLDTTNDLRLLSGSFLDLHLELCLEPLESEHLCFFSFWDAPPYSSIGLLQCAKAEEVFI